RWPRGSGRAGCVGKSMRGLEANGGPGPSHQSGSKGMASRATLPAHCIFYRRFVPRGRGRGVWPWAHRLPVGAMRKSTSGPARRRAGWKLLATLLALAGVAAAVGAWVVWRGIYDVSATTNHTWPVYRLLEVAMHRAVRRRAADSPVPRLDDARLLAKGAACYRDW